MAETTLSAAQSVRVMGEIGQIKASMAPHRIFLSGVSAGCLLAFACGTALVASASPWMQENTPGLVRIIIALVFPYRLVTIMLTGVDLCTASFMKRIPWWKTLMHWMVTFLGNLAGSLFVVNVLFRYGDVFAADPNLRASAVAFAAHKQVAPRWHEIFLRGVGCNWLVCLAVLMGVQGQSLASKTVGMWWPVFAFVPLGIVLGTPGLSVGLYVWKGIVPVVLGNIVGGGLFCGSFYWYMYWLEAEGSSPTASILSK